MSIAARLALRSALEAEFWGAAPDDDTRLRMAMRDPGGLVTKGAVSYMGCIAMDTAIEQSEFPVYQAIEGGIDLAIASLGPGAPGNPGAIGHPGRRAGQALIDLFCEVHASPAPTFKVDTEDLSNPEPADFAVKCLCQWNAPGAFDINAVELVRSLRKYKPPALPPT